MGKLTTTCVTSFLLFISIAGFSQEMAEKFGTVELEDFEIDFEEDQNASAIVLFDCGNTRFVSDGYGGTDVLFIRTKRIKIRDLQDVSLFDVEIPYYHDGYGKTEKVIAIKAYSYNLEGSEIKKTEIDRAGIFTEKFNEYWSAKKFTFPDVREGSILEYQYQFKTPFKNNLPDWEFQSSIPTIHSEYVVAMIPFYQYVLLIQGIEKFDVSISEESKSSRFLYWTNFKEMIHTYVVKNKAAFKDESYISSINNYIAKIDFQLAYVNHPRGGTQEILTSWEDLAVDLNKSEYFGKFIQKSKTVAKKIIKEELDINEKSSLEKIQSIVNYVKITFKWDGYTAKYSSKKIKDLISQKNGNAADINLFLIGMLRAAGMDAQPVILSTRSNGKIWTDYPFKHYFNYVTPLIRLEEGFILTQLGTF